MKPDNLIISFNGHIKLTDFGLSKIGLMNRTTLMVEDRNADKVADMSRESASEFKDSEVLGTPDYIAPEVILSQGYGKAVDWWSVGIILYEFLFGIPPFHGDTVEEIFSNITNKEPEFPTEEELEEAEQQVSVLAKDLISLLLAKNPHRRLGTPPDASRAFYVCVDLSSALSLHSAVVLIPPPPTITTTFIGHAWRILCEGTPFLHP